VIVAATKFQPDVDKFAAMEQRQKTR